MAFFSCRCLRLQPMKAKVLAETSLYFIFSLGSLCSSDVYRRESGRFRTLPFFLTFFLSFHLSRFSFYIIKCTYVMIICSVCCSVCLHRSAARSVSLMDVFPVFCCYDSVLLCPLADICVR